MRERETTVTGATTQPPRKERARTEVRIHIGGVVATREPTVIKTLLGSCVAVCLFDPVTRAGGMNHFILPAAEPSNGEHLDATRFGLHAMDCLVGALQKAGADRRRLVAKLFGGAHVLSVSEASEGVAQRNIRFIEEFVRDERIPVISQDLGGRVARQVHFHTDTGKAYVRRLGGSMRRRVRSEEQVHLRHLVKAPPTFGDVTLFDE
jgi:chemotaxis protein CheD